MITIKNNYNRANAVRIIFYLMMAIDIISAYSNIMQYNLLKAAQLGGSISADDAAVNDSRQRIIGMIQFALIIATVISFIMWFHRSYKNLHQLKVRSLSYTTGWAAGGWFVPFLNLVRPYQIMQEIWHNTQNYLFSKGAGERSASGKIVGWWWAFWILNNVLGNISGRMTLAADSIDQFLLSTQVSIASDVIDMIAMIITLIMITRMIEYEKNLWDFESDPMNQIKSEEPDSGSMNIAGV